MLHLNLSLLFMLMCSCINNNWSISIITLLLSLMISLMNLNQSFFYGDMMFMLSENLSSLMVFLSIFLCLISLISTSSNKMYTYIFMIMVLSLILTMAFLMNNIMLFYIFFEISLIPTLALIIGWGYQPERLQAGSYMMLYTVGASLPLLMFLLNISYITGSFNLYLIQTINLNINMFWWLLAMITAFLVKLPMYMYHLWLPKAHVEAPLAGSMILAGILLKLGGYGLYIMFNSFDVINMKYEFLFISMLSLWGGLLASFMCLRQTDLKAFVAYSSVAHMSLIVVGVIMNTIWGLISVKIILFAHGFTSPCLFLLAYISYMKSGSRSLLYSSGLLNTYPLITLFWFILLSVNMAAPPSLNLMGELFIMPMLWMISGMSVFVMMLLMLFSAIYNMYLYTSINHGGFNKYNLSKVQMKSSELVSIIIHLIPLLLILKAQIFMIS